MKADQNHSSKCFQKKLKAIAVALGKKLNLCGDSSANAAC